MTIIDELKSDLLETIKNTMLAQVVTDEALSDGISSLREEDQPSMFLIILKAVIRDIFTLNKPETELWTLWINGCSNHSDLTCLGACIKLIAGYSVDDKELYLSRLRKLYITRLSKITV